MYSYNSYSGQGGNYAPQNPQGGNFPPQNVQGANYQPQGLQQGNFQQQNVQGYPSGQYSPGVNPEIQQWFSIVDRDHSGKINAKELQAALINGQGKNFSDTACSLMIGMFDRDKNGTIDVSEFQQLYNYINQWLNIFRTYDRDQSGHIEEGELTQAFQQMGFRFSPDFVKFLIMKSDLMSHRQMSVDQFIVVCIQIQRFTEAFRSRDKELKGVITLGFEDFLGIALNCST